MNLLIYYSNNDAEVPKITSELFVFYFSFTLGWSKTPVSSQTDKLMAGTKFSDYLGQNHYKKAKKSKHFIHLRLANRPQSFGS